MVFQFFNLLPELTAVENIGLPMRLAGYKDNEISERTSYLLGSVGLLERQKHYPSAVSYTHLDVYKRQAYSLGRKPVEGCF